MTFGECDRLGRVLTVEDLGIPTVKIGANAIMQAFIVQEKKQVYIYCLHENMIEVYRKANLVVLLQARFLILCC